MKTLEELFDDVRVDLTASLFHVQENLKSITKQISKLFQEEMSKADKIACLEYYNEYIAKFKHHSDIVLNSSEKLDSLQAKLINETTSSDKIQE